MKVNNFDVNGDFYDREDYIVNVDNDNNGDFTDSEDYVVNVDNDVKGDSNDGANDGFNVGRGSGRSASVLTPESSVSPRT